METIRAFADSLSLPPVVLVVMIALLAHLVARVITTLSRSLSARVTHKTYAKMRTIITLGTGVAVFCVYFAAVGAILSEFGISLTAYLGTASVIGLAVGFGSQGIVQDVVTGLTVILSDLIDVNDMVEISGQVGIVQSIGMRFTVLKNPMGAFVYIPNRTLTNMINYPKGYLRCFMDVSMNPDAALGGAMEARLPELIAGFKEQFPGILRAPVEIEDKTVTTSGKSFVRIKFRIWPGRGGPIETTLKQDIAAALLEVDDTYKDSKISVNYEISA